MNKNQIILAILLISFLLGHPLVAQGQPGLVDQAKREYKAFREALTCAYRKGFRACSYEDKKRIMRDGLALLAVMAVIYGSFRVVGWQKRLKLEKERTQAEKKRKEDAALKQEQAEKKRQEELALKQAQAEKAQQEKALAKRKVKEQAKKERQEELALKQEQAEKKRQEEAEKERKRMLSIQLLEFFYRKDQPSVTAAQLIEKGADVNISGKDNGHTPLHLAVKNNNEELVALLLDKGASVTATTLDDKDTPLHLAASGGKKTEAIIQQLITHKADINVQNGQGSTPLHLAARWNRNESVSKILLDNGADVNAKDAYKQTPLHLAVLFKVQIPVLNLLLNKGADVNAVTISGSTPLDVGEEEEIKKLLIKHGAKTSEALRQK